MSEKQAGKQQYRRTFTLMYILINLRVYVQLNVLNM